MLGGLDSCRLRKGRKVSDNLGMKQRFSIFNSKREINKIGLRLPPSGIMYYVTHFKQQVALAQPSEQQIL